MEAGDWYDGDAVERSVQALTTALQNRGFAFVEVKPRVQRDPKKHTIDLVFDVGEGPRVYVERIDIVGNERTMDKVIRREFRLAEGDPFNAALVRASRQRLQDLGYFQSVNIQSQPGSAPDQTVLTTNIQEKATGELTSAAAIRPTWARWLRWGCARKTCSAPASTPASTERWRRRKPRSICRLPIRIPSIATSSPALTCSGRRRPIWIPSPTASGALARRLRLGYAFNDHLRQAWNYSIVQRDVYDVQTNASIYVLDQQGTSLLSQVGQTLSLDYRDSTIDPHSGFIVRLGNDFAGLGGDVDFIRSKIDTTVFVPLDRFTGNSDWGINHLGGHWLSGLAGRPGTKSSTTSSWEATICAASRPGVPVRTRSLAATAWAASSSGRSRPNCISRYRSRLISGSPGAPLSTWARCTASTS